MRSGDLNMRGLKNDGHWALTLMLCFAMLGPKGSGQKFGSHFEWFSSFSSILAPFLSILRLFWVALAPFSSNFVVFFCFFWGVGKSVFWGCCVVVLKGLKVSKLPISKWPQASGRVEGVS